MKIKYAFLLLAIAFISSGCINKSDVKDNFCGVHLNYQYCKCAFHGEYCDAVNMNKGEAKNYVYEKYDDWKNKDISSKTTEQETEKNIEKEGECKYDSDCDNICEGDVMWKQGCNPRENECVKTFDTDCSADIEEFSDFKFPKICKSGECVRDQASINNQRNELETLQKEIINETKELNASRDGLRDAMLDANKNCLNGLADMTNVAIMEFATRVASVMAGGLPEIADVSVDYANDALNKLYGYLDNAEPTEEKKLKPHEYIKLNCDLYHHFIKLQKVSDDELEKLLEEAQILEEQINSLI